MTAYRLFSFGGKLCLSLIQLYFIMMIQMELMLLTLSLSQTLTDAIADKKIHA